MIAVPNPTMYASGGYAPKPLEDLDATRQSLEGVHNVVRVLPNRLD
jgi:hypothetical protein